MKQFNKKIVIALIAVVAVVGGVIYSNNKSTKNISGNVNGQNVQTNTPNGSKGNSTEQGKKEEEKNKITQDSKLTEKIKNENIVLNGQVYVQGDYVIGTMIIKDKVSEAQVKKVAQEYANKLRAQYKDKKVNVQAVQNGKNIANIVIEK